MKKVDDQYMMVGLMTRSGRPTCLVVSVGTNITLIQTKSLFDVGKVDRYN